MTYWLDDADLNPVHWEMKAPVRVGERYNKEFEYFAVHTKRLIEIVESL